MNSGGRPDHGVWTPITLNAPTVSNSLTRPLNTITTYGFRVRAIDSSGSGVSAWTANDLARTMSFAAVQTNVTVAFDHFEQIRIAINAILSASKIVRYASKIVRYASKIVRYASTIVRCAAKHPSMPSQGSFAAHQR